MGLEIKAFTIRDISDVNGYLQALGMKRIAEVKRDAEIAQAESAKEAKIRIADANKQGEQARIIAESQIAEYNKDKEINIQIYRKDSEVEKARAGLAYEIEANRVKKEVVETQMQVEMIKKEKKQTWPARKPCAGSGNWMPPFANKLRRKSLKAKRQPKPLNTGKSRTPKPGPKPSA
jgi:uncharacterized membrane protein YqiK